MSDTVTIDAQGRRCPRPIIELAKTRRQAEPGTIVEIIADDLAFESDVRAWCETTGNELVELTKDGDAVTARIKLAG